MRTRPRLTLAHAAPAHLVTFAAAPAPSADVGDRTLWGLLVPFNSPGMTSDGLLTFARGSIIWSPDVRRVKLLVEHDQMTPVGYATAIEERDDGVWGTFAIPPGEAGDRVLSNADNGLRDALSLGVALDGATHARLRRAVPGQAVASSGHLRETSVVTVPAFDDARLTSRHLVSASAAGGLTSAAGGLTTMTTPTMPTSSPPAPLAPAPAGVPAPPPAPAATAPPAASPPAGGAPPSVPPPAAPAAPAGPSTVVAAHAAALTVASEPSTYGFNGNGPSLIRDAYAARFDGDAEAAGRLRRFNAELTAGNLGSVAAFTRAASARLTTAAPGDPIVSPAQTDDLGIPASYLAQPVRSDLMLRLVDAGRPITSRLNRIAISNAQPFLIPVEGEFVGVADHVEGTAHVAEGTLTLADAPVMPRAVSGAYRVSRELADATNPAIDQIALRAMLRDYRRVSEGKVIDALVASDVVAIASVNTSIELRAALVGFVNDDDEPADFVAVSATLLAALFAEVDTTGRPMLATVGTAPAAGSPRAGYTGLGLDGTDVVRASRLPAGSGFMIRSAGVLFVESPVQQFRFDEIEGPGILKLALWAYVGAAVLRAEDVSRINVGA